MVKYKNKFSVIQIICNSCKNIFSQEARVHTQGHGCPFCNSSKGEKQIEKYLTENNISFEHPKKYDDLKDKSYLFYDFYIPSKNLLIEFNGIQHYKFIPYFHKTVHDFHRQLHHDWLKRKYARKNGITLLVIPYTKFDNIDDILTENLSKEKS